MKGATVMILLGLALLTILAISFLISCLRGSWDYYSAEEDPEKLRYNSSVAKLIYYLFILHLFHTYLHLFTFY